MATIAVLGHVQEADESAEASTVEARFGSLKRAFALVKRVAVAGKWEAIATVR